jgi:hypothetical protein
MIAEPRDCEAVQLGVWGVVTVVNDFFLVIMFGKQTSLLPYLTTLYQLISERYTHSFLRYSELQKWQD